ncbi:hypothetical protein BT63DRAFT_412571 [Microthyrium microscopicum]|uniref:Uncharacterized protein n=1 Tax=Microthyrium microscopicum TaxID=703497 RepID=A0A6A6UEB3_9PEZI|nr:hypothetical protein BT63DRAFT_412571 [Microthyrium microscopicum]
MSTATNDNVHIGRWTDWDRGRVLGSTITLPTTQGAFLIAFLALYIRFAGNQLWNILCFFLHQHRSTIQARDGHHHQLQALLRNALVDTSTIWETVKLTYLWRSKTTSAVRKSLLVLFFATLNWVGFAVAGIFSSRVALAGNLALRNPGTCGWMSIDLSGLSTELPTEAAQRINAMYVFGRRSAKLGMDYSASCYANTTEGMPATCRMFARANIPSTIDRSAPCPFANNLCNGPAVQLDSGLVDSSKFGLNTRQQEKIQFRRQTTCALIPTNRFVSDWTREAPVPRQRWDVAIDDSYLYYSYGQNTQVIAYNWAQARTNYSFVRSNASFLTQKDSYDLGCTATFAGNLTDAALLSSFVPRKELAVDSGDLTLLMLSNQAQYLGPVVDTWFSASSTEDNRNLGLASTVNASVYYPDSLISTMGCIEKYQYCNNDVCTPLDGYYTVSPDQDNGLHMNTRQRAVFRIMLKAAWSSKIKFLSQLVGAEGLLAQQFVEEHSGGLASAPVYPDQWKQEVENMHNISLAVLQQKVADYANQPYMETQPGIGVEKFIIPPGSPEEAELCNQIKIRSTSHTSFSLFGTILILLVGGLIILINIWLPAIVFRLRDKERVREEYKAHDWWDSGTLQIQRAAYESQGIGPWEGAARYVPVTALFESRPE